MPTQTKIEKYLIWEDAPSFPKSPDELLCLAILERANRDIGIERHIEPHIKRDAIQWFLEYFNKPKTNPPKKKVKELYIFSFESIIDVCGLTKTQIDILREKVKHVEKNYGQSKRDADKREGLETEEVQNGEDVEEQGESRRKGSSQSFKIVGVWNRTKNRTVQRETGTFTCRRNSR